MGFSYKCELPHLKNKPRKKIIVIGILWTGEPQIEQLLTSILKLKIHYEVIVKVVAFEENLTAHLSIWKFFEKNIFADFRVKLDGDMNIQKIDLFVDSIESLDLDSFYVSKVLDEISGEFINGINIFTKNYILDYSNCSHVFPDNLAVNNKQIEYSGVAHCKEATPLQIGEFIGHRIKKIFYTKGVQSRYSYFRLAFKAFINNINSIFTWIGIAINSCYSKDYKTAVAMRNKDVHLRSDRENEKFIKELLEKNEFNISKS